MRSATFCHDVIRSDEISTIKNLIVFIGEKFLTDKIIYMMKAITKIESHAY